MKKREKRKLVLVFEMLKEVRKTEEGNYHLPSVQLFADFSGNFLWGYGQNRGEIRFNALDECLDILASILEGEFSWTQ